jgi:hypothetical protein
MDMKMYEQSLKIPLIAWSEFRLVKVIADQMRGVSITNQAHRWYVLLLQSFISPLAYALKPSFHTSLRYLPKMKRPVARDLSAERSYTLV